MTIALWTISLVVSAVLGYYLTKLVLHLAQRKAISDPPSGTWLESKQPGNTQPVGIQPSNRQPNGTLDAPSDVLAAEVTPDSRASSTIEPADSSKNEHVTASEGPDGLAARNALRGGMWIGVLERILITGFILAGQFAGVAVVVAIKGLGRYPELNAHTSERFIIGTLASLLWACACGWLGLYAIGTWA